MLIIFMVAGTVIIPVPTMVVEILNTAPANDAPPKFCSSKDLSWCSSSVGQPLQPHSGSQADTRSSRRMAVPKKIRVQLGLEESLEMTKKSGFMDILVKLG
ncbi:hypothetical protein L484_012285 [Morus notabilis]|uniref:Uncharacterized protein n=1 Tax=Morus notabilis TaxID=981085 RepID=W9QXF0_9ROSA|nr:hypothetical protein L484_012285 [Morus notabilis]